MNVKLVALSMLALSGACAAASSNTVQFKGEVSTQTCSVNINGNQSNPVVLLPTVAASKLATKGATAGDTTFTVNVTGCAAATSDTAIKTVLAGNNPTTNGNHGQRGRCGQSVHSTAGQRRHHAAVVRQRFDRHHVGNDAGQRRHFHLAEHGGPLLRGRHRRGGRFGDRHRTVRH